MAQTAYTSRQTAFETLANGIIYTALAAVAWSGGVFTTWLLVAGLSGNLPESVSLAVFVNSDLLVVAAVIQAVLTGMESPIWRRRKSGMLTWAALAFDTLINAGGLWVWLRNLPDTQIATMLSEALGVQLGGWSLFVITLIIGATLAYAPEGILRQR